MKQPYAVLIGHAAFLGTVALSGALTLLLGLPGCLIGALSLPLGSLASGLTMRLVLKGFAGPREAAKG
jgi:hypothetical protein